MQEVSPNIFIENNSLGLFTGVIRITDGSILVDSPIRQDDQKTWRSATAKMVTGEPRFLINLDTNFDRLISSKSCECVMIAHQQFFGVNKTRQATIKLQDDSAGIDFHDGINGAARWNPPEISFQNELFLNFGELEIKLEHHPGSNLAGLWVILPKQKVIFVGDSVLVDQPPFLAFANLDAWIQDLQLLSSKPYKAYQIISSRSGIVNQEQVKSTERIIVSIKKLLDPLFLEKKDLDSVLAVIPKILKRFDTSSVTNEVFYNRLKWGLSTYYEQNTTS